MPFSQDPAVDCLEITSFSNTDTTNPLNGKNARKLRVVTGSGTIVVTTSTGQNRTLTMSAGEEEILYFSTLVSASGITRVRVSW